MENALALLISGFFVVLIFWIMWDANRQVGLFKSSEEEFPFDEPPAIEEETEITPESNGEKII